MANLDNLPAFLRSKGLTVVETPGWITRGYAGQDLKEIRGVLWHHTATASARYSLTGAPTLAMCINGRSDLAGPLCNIVFGRNGVVYMVATGVANHAGAGSAPGIPDDMGNHYLIGIEMESSGVAPWDWTPAQLATAPRLGAAIEQWGLQHLAPEMRLQLGHMEYSSQGKIDPAGWPGGMNGLRAAINTVLAAKPPQAAKPAPAPAPPTPAKAKDKMLVITKAKGDTAIWIGDGITRRQIKDVRELTALRAYAKAGALNIYKNGDTQDWPPADLGVVVKEG